MQHFHDAAGQGGSNFNYFILSSVGAIFNLIGVFYLFLIFAL